MIAIIAILAGMLMPALSKARQRAQTSSCVNNLKQMDFYIKTYNTTFDDFLMPFYHYNYKNTELGPFFYANSWLCNAIQKYSDPDEEEWYWRKTPAIMQCPAVPLEVGVRYSRQTGYKRLRYISYTMGSIATYSLKTIERYRVHKINRFRHPTKIPLVLDGVGNEVVPLQYNADDVYTNPAGSPAGSTNRRVDYRHGGETNILTLAGNVTHSARIYKGEKSSDGNGAINTTIPF